MDLLVIRRHVLLIPHSDVQPLVDEPKALRLAEVATHHAQRLAREREDVHALLAADEELVAAHCQATQQVVCFAEVAERGAVLEGERVERDAHARRLGRHNRLLGRGAAGPLQVHKEVNYWVRAMEVLLCLLLQKKNTQKLKLQ